MSTTINFKPGLDKPLWAPCSPPLMQGPTQLFYHDILSDLRNNTTRIPQIFLSGAGPATISTYNPILDEWNNAFVNPISLGNGSFQVFHPQQGPRGTITTGATTTSVVLSTALPASVGANQLTNRGDGVGYRLKIIGNSAAASGKTEEVTVTANTSGTTPTINFTPALTFTPASGDAYEFLSGKIYGAQAGGSYKSFDILTAATGTLSTTNFATTTDAKGIPLCELYVSNDRNPGDGFIDNGSTYNNTINKCFTASGGTTTTIIANALTNPSTPSLFTNEYRNFQIRVVEDTTNPTNVGARYNITSHTSGNTPTFTVPTMTFAPTANVTKFVLEQNNDRIIVRTGSSASTYTYNIGANTWDTTTFSAAGNAVSNGAMFIPCFGITRDPTGNRLQGQFWLFRGNGGNVDFFDMTAAATGTWTNGATIFGFSNSLYNAAIASCGVYDPVTLGGKFFHITGLGLVSGQVWNPQQRFHRFDVVSGTLFGETYLRYPGLNSSSVTGNRLTMNYMFDGATKLGILYCSQPYAGIGHFLFSLALEA